MAADVWESVPPAPPSDPVYTTPGPYIDPTFAQHSRHLASDLSRGAAREFSIVPPLLPDARAFPALAVIGLNGTASHARGIALPTLLLYGGTDGVRVFDDMWTFTARTALDGFDSQGACGAGAACPCCVGALSPARARLRRRC